MRTTVFVRFVFESPYINAFIDHYKYLGFDNIIVLFHEDYILGNTFKNYIDKEFINNVISRDIKVRLNNSGYLDKKFIMDDSIVLHPVKNYKNKLYGKFKNIIPNTTEWLLVVDSDEFLVINNKFKNISELINESLKTTPNLYCFQFKWTWVTNSVSSKELSMKNIILQHNCYENKKIRSIVYNCKTLHRYYKGMTYGNHCASDNKKFPKYLISEVVNTPKHMSQLNKKLKKSSINEQTLGFIVHVRLRSFHNLIFKTLNNYGIKSKNIARKDGNFLEYFTSKMHTKINPDKCFKRLVDFNLFLYEKRHFNNIVSVENIITSNFSKCLKYSTLFTFKNNEKKFYDEWIENEFSTKLTHDKFNKLKHNIEFYDEMLSTFKACSDSKYNILIQ